MTLVESVVASVLFATLTLLVLAAITNLTRMVDVQAAINKADNQGSRALGAITTALKPAILPVLVKKSSEERNNIKDVYYDIDHEDWGFSNKNGDRWKDALAKGMDCIAFVHPIDAQSVGDYLDDANHVQIGQIRGDVAYFGASFTGTPGSGQDFIIRNQGTNEPVNFLAEIRPDRLTNPAFEVLSNPTATEWRNLVNGSWPGGGAGDVTPSFMAIRYVPVADSSGNPVVITENNIFKSSISVDLDGDGTTNGTFHIGSLQMLYTGGPRLHRVIAVSAVREVAIEDQPQLIVPLTGNVVLRRAVEADRTPIFKLVSHSRTNIVDGGGAEDFDGIVNIGPKGGEGKTALAVRLLILDNEGVDDSGSLAANINLQTLTARWHETTLVLMNMER